jgi:hypothetical protein
MAKISEIDGRIMTFIKQTPVKPLDNLTQGGIVLPFKNLTQADSR